MNTAEFEYLSTLVQGESGIVLTEDKAYLLTSRLNPVATQHGFASIDNMVAAMKLGRTSARVVEDIVDAMTTNESYFFRNRKPVDGFEQDILPYFAQARSASRKLRIWCAAASSGQEPYSLAILLKEAAHRYPLAPTFPVRSWKRPAPALQPVRSAARHAHPIAGQVFRKRGEMWQIDSALRAMVEYRRFNLLDRMVGLGAFDIVFCRNVLIYFDRETKADILARISEKMAPDGVLGAAETVIGISTVFETMQGQRGFFQRTDVPGQQQPQDAARLTA